jgi:hypothetical protein
MVHLLLETPHVPASGPVQMSSPFSSGGLRDVRLEGHPEGKDGVRTMKIMRSLAAVPAPGKNAQSTIECTALQLSYTLKDGVLALKGFSKEGPTSWGQLEFTLPATEITFRAVR